MRRGTSGINAVIAVDKPLGMTSHDVGERSGSVASAMPAPSTPTPPA